MRRAVTKFVHTVSSVTTTTLKDLIRPTPITVIPLVIKKWVKMTQ